MKHRTEFMNLDLKCDGAELKIPALFLIRKSSIFPRVTLVQFLSSVSVETTDKGSLGSA